LFINDLEFGYRINGEQLALTTPARRHLGLQDHGMPAIEWLGR
jgi:hypothetical protein